MSEIVCQVSNQPGQVEFIWSSHGGFFQPYIVSGPELIELRAAADQTRSALEALVFALNEGEGTPPWEPSFALAEAGFKLYNYLLPTEDQTAKKVRRWLEDVRKESGLIGLEIVVEERSPDVKGFLSVPWNLIYDERPSKSKTAFQKGEGVERWRPFWAVRYNLTSGRRVEPLKRVPTWTDPRVVMVIDPTVRDGLGESEKARLDGFLSDAGLEALGSLDELEAALEEGYPRLLYWMGHATPEYLMLGDDRIAPSDLRNLLRSFDDRDRPEGMLAFLNACQTAEAGSGGSFLEVLHSFGFTGAIATERQTIDTFANEFGLAFLQGFLHQGKSLGELLHSLRVERAPLGLLYGVHCPPEIHVRIGGSAESIPIPRAIRESGPILGNTLGAPTLPQRLKSPSGLRKPAPAVPLPDEPYRSLAFYEEKDRALFTGRDADVVRFAATLDRTDTRIVILHGESGTGKSSFLRAGVIPYLELECVGYRFFRQPGGEALIVQTGKDLVGQVAQALLDASSTVLNYDSPDGEPHQVDLRPVLDEAVQGKADYATLRDALRGDFRLLATILTRMSGRLPHALVLILDQVEEVFTLVPNSEPEGIASRNHGLRMLQRVIDVSADVKLIISLRTEYYGRLLDHLRDGRRDLTGVRDELLRDFNRLALIEAIARPASMEPVAPGQPSPGQKYGFRYAEGIPGLIADGVLAMRSENQDSVLPLAQVICTQLYHRETTQPGMDGVITREDLDAIKGVEGGLRAFAEDALERSLRLDHADREAFKSLFIQLYSRQPDGTLTTWLKPRESLEHQWSRPRPFAELLEAAKAARLLREDELRIEGSEPRRYIRLGHDALAKVAAAWQVEVEEKERLEQERARRRKQFRQLAIGSLFSAGLALVFALGGLYVFLQNVKLSAATTDALMAKGRQEIEADKARAAQKQAVIEAQNARLAEKIANLAAIEANRQKRTAQLRLMHATYSQVEQLWRAEPERGLALLLDPTRFPSAADRDFTWGYYYIRCHRVRSLMGHEGFVLSVALSVDGKLLASSGSDGKVRLRFASNGAPKALLEGHDGEVYSVAFSLDGKSAVTGGADKTVRLWNLETGQAGPILRGHDGDVLAVAFSPDGQSIASGGSDGKVRVWDLATGKPRMTLEGHAGKVNAVAFNPDGKTLASGGDDGTVRVWDPTLGKAIRTIGEHKGGVNAVAFSPSRQTLASAGDDGMVRLWDLDKRALKFTLGGHVGEALAVAFSRDGNALASTGTDGTLRLWDPTTARSQAVLEGRKGAINAGAFYPDGKTIATAGSDGTVRLWDVNISESLAILGGHLYGVQSIAFSPDGKTVATASADKLVRLWDARTGQLRATLEGHTDGVNSVAFSPDGKVLGSGGTDTTVRVWDLASLKTSTVLEGHEGSVDAVAFSPDGESIVSGGKDKAGRIWTLATGKPRLTLEGYDGTLNALAYSPDGKTIASGGTDKTVRVWDAGTGTLLATLEGHHDEVFSVRFSLDGKTLASASDEVRLWDVEHRQLRATLGDHEGPVLSVSFSPDGKTLASGGSDSTVRLWDLATGEARATLKGHQSDVYSVSFSPDGKTLGSGSGDKTARLWDAAFPD